MNNILYNFFKESSNSHARENIINHKFFFDLYISAAKRNYEIQIYIPKTDHQGFDAILNDNNNFHKIQIKTVLSNSTTKNWEIHSKLIRPDFTRCKYLGFHVGNSGFEGGVVLIDIETIKDEIKLNYFYTDIYILNAIAMKITKNNKKYKNALKILKSLEISDTVKIPKSLFIKVKNTDILLHLCGLHSNFEKNTFYFRHFIKENGKSFWSQGGPPLDKILLDELKDFFKFIE